MLETLAAVAILITLIAMLIPALAKSRRAAQTASCLANLRQLHDAFYLYRRDNGDHIFAEGQSAAGIWMSILRPMVTGTDAWMCPEAANPSYGWGSAHQAWGPFDSAHGSDPSLDYIGPLSSSYGFNGWLYSRPRGSWPHWRRHSLDSLHVPVFADANWVDGKPDRLDPLPADLNRGSGFGEPEMGRFTLARHGRSVNVSFIDGQAQQVPLEELWGLDWTPTFVQGNQVHQEYSPSPGTGDGTSIRRGE